MDQQPIQGRRPTPEQVVMNKAAADYWHKVSYEAPTTELAKVEEAARQLIALTSTLQGIYFAVFTFSDVGAKLSAWQLLIFLAPVLFWLLSLFCATLVFVPRVQHGIDVDDARYDAWEHLRTTYRETVVKKLFRLHLAHGFLVVSFVTILMLLGMLSFLPDAPAAGPTQIIIVQPTPTMSSSTP